MKLPKGFGGQGFTGMLQKAQVAMARAKSLNEELAMERLTIDRGPVKMVFDGLGELHGLKIDPAVVDPEDVEALEDLILSAVRSGFQEAVARREQKMQEIMPDMPDIGI